MRLSTGEIALAHRCVQNNLGVPQVTMNPDDGLKVTTSDDVVVLTQIDSRFTFVEMDDGRE